MSEWVVQYKCRRCGSIIEGAIGAENNCFAAVCTAIRTGGSDQFGIPVLLISTHSCEDGAYSVTDLIGCEERK